MIESEISENTYDTVIRGYVILKEMSNSYMKILL